MTLTGFTRDTSFTPVPNPVLGQVLEDVQDLAELKVTLRALWLLHRKKGRLLAISVEELLADRCLWRGLSGPGKDPDAEVRRGLELAVRRGTFLSCPGPVQTASGAPESGQLVFLNDEAGRLAMARQREQGGTIPAAAAAHPEPPAGPKPNIFSLYEDNIGSLSPILAEELKEAEERYPWGWIREAFRIAVMENKRSWRYVAGILRRWGAEGKDEGKQDGKPGRHSAADQRQKYLEQYKRQRSHRDRSYPGG